MRHDTKTRVLGLALSCGVLVAAGCAPGTVEDADNGASAALLGGLFTTVAAGGLTLDTNQALTLSDATYRLIMQTDGNLVLYHASTPLWASATPGACTSCRASFQTDGNLVLYNLATGAAYWQTGTSGYSTAALRVASQSPYLEIANGPRALWATQTSVCGASAVNNAAVDAAAPLRTCITNAVNAGLNLVELVPGRYYMNGTLDITGLSHVTIRTQNDFSGPACLDVGAHPCAVLTAMPTNPGPQLLLSDQSSAGAGATNLVLDHIAIDGNIGPRRARYNSGTWAEYSTRGRFADNAMIHACSGCQFFGFTSTRAAQGTGLEYTGDNAVFNGVYFFENGWGANAYTADTAWSDGLTLLASTNLQIVNSKFEDNSDVDLVIGHAPHGIITGNLIQNHINFSFAGLMFDNFNNSQDGDFTDAIIDNNTVDCSTGMCGIGLGLGPHLWYQSKPIIGTGAVVQNNSITGAKQGLITFGANGFSLANNAEHTNGAYAGTNYNGCTAKPFSITAGDSITVVSNNYENGVPAGYSATNLLVGCAPKDLPPMVVDIAGVAYAIAVDYRDIVDRDPDVAGGQSYTQQLNEGVSNATLRSTMAHGAEAAALLNGLYEKYLGRPIDASGLATYQNELASGAVTIDTLRPILQLSAEALSNPYRVY